ncbi:MAG: GTPase HflX, partial [Chlorobiales bacterium]|nr:GTPase HflX [Chlorobiales bacterium]
MRGLRLVHTHLKGEPISDDDLNDLLLLRLDLLAVIYPGSSPEAPPLLAFASLSDALSTSPYQLQSPRSLLQIDISAFEFIDTLQKKLERSVLPSHQADSSEERAILISVTQTSQKTAQDSITELQELSRTAGLSVLENIIQRPRQISSRFLLGEGKLREVVIRALQLGATMLVFDQELTPSQVRSISAMTELKVIDRSQLFARREKISRISWL